MHRSGTSAVTRALHLLGLDAGSPEALMDAAPSNQSGHWEVEALTAFNDRLLAEAGGRWSAPPLGPIGINLPDAGSLLDAAFGEGRWVWKDPRLCLTLGLWRTVFDVEPVGVVVLRDPRAIAGSLARRNGFSAEYSLALWERHLRCLWGGLAGLRAIVVAYDELLADPTAGVASLAEFVGLDGDRHEAEASLDAGARHHAPSGRFTDDPMATPQQAQLYERSAELVGSHEEFPAVDLGSETPNLQLSFDEHARMTAFEEETHRLAAAKAWVEAELDRQTVFLHTELERRSAEASQLAEDVMAARAETDALRMHLDRITNRLPMRLYLWLRRGSRH